MAGTGSNRGGWLAGSSINIFHLLPWFDSSMKPLPDNNLAFLVDLSTGEQMNKQEDLVWCFALCFIVS